MSVTFPHVPTAIVIVALSLFPVDAIHAQPKLGTPSTEKPQSDGDRLVLLLKKVADEGLLFEPDRLAKVLDLDMKFETELKVDEPSCDAGGYTKSVESTRSEIRGSWFRATAEGVPNMKLPADLINQQDTVVGEPYVTFSYYRSTYCKMPNYTRSEATINFINLSSFSCLSPDRLQKLIGAEHFMEAHGLSISTYRPPARYAYGVYLSFSFKSGAPCAFNATVSQDWRRGLRLQRAKAKWQACADKARSDYCASNSIRRMTVDWIEVDAHRASVCEPEDVYEIRESVDGLPVSSPPWQPRPERPCVD